MPPHEFTIKTYEMLLAEYTKERGSVDYEPVHLGFGAIDAEIRGLSAGQVLGVAARTAVGKSWMLEAIEHNFAARRDAGCLALSLEMPGIEWAERALAIFADVPPEQVEQWARHDEVGRHAAAFLDRMQNARVVEEFVRLNDLPLVIEQTRAELAVPLRLLLIDYLGLLAAEGRDVYERISKVGLGLKRIAKEQAVAIVVAMQVSRAGGDGSEPVTISMLRDSGVLEESLDFLLGAWRPGKANNLTPPEAMNLRDVLRVAVLKNRKGEDGRVVDLRFRSDSRRLYEQADPFTAAV